MQHRVHNQTPRKASSAVLKLAALGALAATLPAGAGTFTWLSTNTAAGPYDWNSAGNWSTSAGTYPLAAGDVATVTANIAANATINLNEAVTVGALTLGDTNNTHTITIAPAGGSLTFDNSGSSATLTQVSTSKGDTISAGINVAGNLTVLNSSTNALVLSGGMASSATTGTQVLTFTGRSATVSGSISNGGTGGTLAIVKSGTAGTLALSTANSFTGGVTLNEGSLSLSNSAALGTGTLTINGGALYNGAALSLSTNNAQIWNGSFSVNHPISSNLNMGTGAVTLNNNITLTMGGNAYSSLFTVGGNISDGGNNYGLTLTAGGSSPGALQLSGSNTFTGGVTLNSAYLRIGSAYALGTGTLTVNGGTLNSNYAGALAGLANIVLAGDLGTNNGGQALNLGTIPVSLIGNRTITVDNMGLTMNGIVSGTGSSLTYKGTQYNNSITLGGANTFDGGIQVISGGANATVYASNTSALGTGQARLTSNANVKLNLSSSLTVDSLSSAITAPTLTNQGSGYTGTPTVEISGGGGTGATAIATTSAGKVTGITITNYGKDYTSAPTFTIIGTTTGTAAVVTGNFAASTVILNSNILTIAGTNASPATYSGVITGSGSLVKNGAGIQVLTGANTYTGTTRINNGVLTIDGAGSINSSTTIVLNGGELKYNSSTALTKAVTFTSGKLSGTGSISTAITVGAGAILSPGNSPGSQSFTDLTWTTGGEYLWEINDQAGTAGANPGWDLINVGGTLNISSLDSSNKFNINITGLEGVGTAPATTTSWTILNYGTLNGSFNADLFSLNASGFDASWNGTWSIADTGSSLQLTYSVPEPAMLALLGLGGLTLLRRRKNG